MPGPILRALRRLVRSLPDSTEQPAWTGVRWLVRRRTYAHVFTIDSQNGPTTMLSFRSPEPERGFLLAGGHPFFRAGWGTDVVVMVLEDTTDWGEVGELLTESYCVMAPKKLAAMVPGAGSAVPAAPAGSHRHRADAQQDQCGLG